MIAVKLTDRMLERWNKCLKMHTNGEIDDEQLFMKTANIIGVQLQ